MIESRMKMGAGMLAALCTAAVLTMAFAVPATAQGGFDIEAVGPEQEGDVSIRFDADQCDAYVPLGIYEVRLTLLGTVNLGAMGVELMIPDGWRFNAVSGECPPDVRQIEATDNLFEFAWTQVAPGFLPCSFSVFLDAPVGSSVDQVFAAQALYRTLEGSELLESEQVFFVVAEGGACIAGIGCGAGTGGAAGMGGWITLAVMLGFLAASGVMIGRRS